MLRKQWCFLHKERPSSWACEKECLQPDPRPVRGNTFRHPTGLMAENSKLFERFPNSLEDACQEKIGYKAANISHNSKKRWMFTNLVAITARRVFGHRRIPHARWQFGYDRACLKLIELSFPTFVPKIWVNNKGSDDTENANNSGWQTLPFSWEKVVSPFMFFNHKCPIRSHAGPTDN